MFFLIWFLIFFIIFFGFASGGIAPRMMYTLTVSNGVWNFIQNYSLSYQISYDQIHSTEKYFPEVNATLERLMTMYLENHEDISINFDIDYMSDCSIVLYIYKPKNLYGNEREVKFNLYKGRINDTKYAISPINFILGEKLYRQYRKEKQVQKYERKKHLFS